MNEIESGLRSLRGRVGETPADVEQTLRNRIADKGLADVAYATVDSPLGRLLAATTKRGLVRLAYDNQPLDDTLDDLALSVSPRIIEDVAALDGIRRQLDEYFEGRRRSFEFAVDWSWATGFVRRVLKATAAVPFGSVASYAQVATKAGSPRASRAAGNALGSNPIPIVVPCHRILRTGGALGGYTGGLHRKEFLLHLEGVEPGPNPRRAK